MHSEDLISICMILQPHRQHWKHRELRDNGAGSAYSNAKSPFECPRQTLFPNPTQQTNEDEWLNMKADFKCIMWAFIFAFGCLFMGL